MRLTHIVFGPNGILCKSTNAIGWWYWPNDDPRTILLGLSTLEIATADIRVTQMVAVSTTACPLDDEIALDIADMVL